MRIFDGDHNVNARAWPQQCLKSCTINVGLRFGNYETKEMLGVLVSNV